MPATPSGRQADATDDAAGRCPGDADKESSPRKGRSGDDNGINAEERGWPRRRADADDNAYGR